jgi:hypothetical protein
MDVVLSQKTSRWDGRSVMFAVVAGLFASLIMPGGPLSLSAPWLATGDVAVPGYVLKGASSHEIVQAIAAVGNGAAIFSPTIAQRVLDFFAAPRSAGPILTCQASGIGSPSYVEHDASTTWPVERGSVCQERRFDMLQRSLL